MKAERYKLGEVRLKIQYTSLKPKKEREIKGLVVEVEILFLFYLFYFLFSFKTIRVNGLNKLVVEH